jgi:hypothetical protein
MISSQRRDGQFSFGQHLPIPYLLSVTPQWRKESIVDVNIYVGEGEKGGKPELGEITEMYSKLPTEKPKEWTDNGVG